MRKKFFSKTHIYLLSVLLPAAVLVISLYYVGIYPGSDKTILVYDLGGQIVSFLSYFRHIGNGFNNIMYQSLSGLGGGYFGTWAYYTSNPVNILFRFVGEKSIPDVVYFLIVSKVSLCGLSMFLFLKYGHLKLKNDFLCLAFSCSYSLMSYSIMYMILPMWIDAVIMLPFVILGADRIFEEGKCIFFIVSFSVSIFLNYYISYMTALFVIVYFFCFLFSKEEYSGSFFKYFFRFLFSGLLSVLLSSWILVPVVYDYLRGKLNAESTVSSFIIRNPLEVLRQLFPLSYDSYLPSDSPKIYCGIVPVIFMVLFFASKKISLRKKVSVFFVCLIFFLSFSVSYMDIFWQCFRIPSCFPSRYSFLFVFFVIMVSAETAGSLFRSDLFKNNKIYVPVLLIAVFVIFDLSLNTIFTVSSVDKDSSIGSFLNRSLYSDMSDRNGIVRSYTDEEKYILDSDYYCSIDDGLLFGMPSLEYYSSSYNSDLYSFIGSLGINSYDRIMFDDGINVSTASLLGISYFSEHVNGFEGSELSDHFNKLYDLNDFRIYKLKDPVMNGFILKNDDIKPLDYNVFENINKVYCDSTGSGDLFVKCNSEVEESGVTDSKFYNVVKVYPNAGMHIFFYVSPQDYIENRSVCYDQLYLGESMIANYNNMCQRYIVDLGYSDGTPLIFTYVTGKKDNEVFFYSFDPHAFENAIGTYSPLFSELEYSQKGITGRLTSVTDSDAILLLPYENGYTIMVDGKEIQYSDYRKALLKIHVVAGEHDVEISYFTPGLVLGLCLSFFGIFILICYTYFVNKSKINNNL